MNYSVYNWIIKVKKYYPFSGKELIWIGISIAVMTFIVGFDDGKDEFVAATFLGNLLVSLIAVTVAVVIHESAHRIAAPNLGYKLEFRPFFFGIIGGLILTFMTYGKVLFLAYGSFHLDIMEKHRLGYFRHYLGYFDNGKVAVVGPLANLFAAMIFRSMVFLPEALVTKLVWVNVLFAITNMLPIPPLDGGHVMYSTKTLYPFIMASIIGAAALLLIPTITWWMAVLGALAIGIAWTMFFVNIVEGKLFGNF